MDNSNDSIRELFGPPPPRRPIPSNSFNALVKIFSLFPDHNPFSEYASYAELPGYLKRCHDNLNNTKQQRSVDFCNDGVGPRGDLEASKELVVSTTVEASKLSINDEVNNRGVAEDLCKDVNCSGLKLMINELDGLNQHKSMNKMPSDEEGTVTGMAEANELIMYELGSTNKNKKTDKMLLDEVGVGFQMAKVDKIYDELSDIERILMNEADDFGVSQLPDKDVNIGFLNDFSLILDADVCNNDSMTIESRKSGEPSVAVNMKGNVEGEKNQRNVGVNRSTSGGDEANSHTHLSAVRKRSDCQELVNQCVNASPGEAQRKDRKLCEEKISQKLSEIGGLTFAAQKSDNERTVLSGDRKANHSGIVTKDKTKDAMDKSEKDVNSGKSKLSSIGGGTSYNMKYGGADSVVRAKMVEQNVCGNTEKFSSRKVENDTKCRERVQFSRQELLNLRKMPSIHEEILKRIRKIDAEVHGKDQNSAAGKIIGSSIMNKKQGSLEGKKEKKKRKRRLARAEMNKKLGVKRLKLKPDLKPKVIATCRHYLKGRCQEGENCKFSHDQLPLTKFKPCCHFARQACMKGDDCPFDHQLSNYPCNAYVDTGFCSRGDSCLFSHKNSAKAGSETVADVSKWGTTTLDKLNKSNFKHQHKADVCFSSGIATPNCLEEDLSKQASQPAKAPKGLSFLPLRKSSLKDSSNHEETDLFQKFGGAPETSGQLNIATTSTVNLVRTLMDTPPSDAPEEKGFISSLKASVGSSGHKKPANPSFHCVNPSFVPKTASLLDSAKHEKMHSSNRSDDTVGTSNQLNKVMPSRLPDPSPMIPKPISGPFSGEHLYDQGGGKSQAVLPCTGSPDALVREKESANGPEKAIQRKVCDSSNSSGQCSTKGGVKDAPSTAERALLSTLAFAAKFESGIKMTSAATSKVAKDEGTRIISSGCRQNEPSKASAILDFLYSGGKKENSKDGI